MGDARTMTVSDILQATGGRLVSGDPGAVFTGISTDSRTVAKGELFLALRGERFDGHDFLPDALRHGRGAIVSTPFGHGEGEVIILVEDTLKALQKLAYERRIMNPATVIGVTGTNGKTTTKELIASIIGISHKILKNAGNLNNQIGLPLSLLKLRGDEEFVVLEMGASRRGDIKELCDIAVPDAGVVTNIGFGHLEGFGDIKGVRNTKLELFDASKTIAVNADDAFLLEGINDKLKGWHKPAVITFGMTGRPDVLAEDITLEERTSLFTIRMADGRRIEIVLHLPGRFNILNALAAASICDALGIGLEEIKKGIEVFSGVPMRLELKELPGTTIISDTYNANPLSMEEAIKELVRLRRIRAIAVLGDMLELGPYAEEAHRKLGRWMSALPVDLFIAVGPLMAKAAEEFSVSHGQSLTVQDSSEAARVLRDIRREGDTILLKGSRGMRMERVLEEYPEKELVQTGREAGNAL